MKKEKDILYNLRLDLNKLAYYVDKIEFEEVYEAASESMKATYRELIIGAMALDSKLRVACITNLKQLLHHATKEDTNIKSLRDKAYIFGIKGWSRLPKEDLIVRIKQYEQQHSKVG